MFGYFYHGTVRKFVVAFGTLFNNIYINRVDDQGNNSKFRVPLAYAQKYIRRVQEFPYLQSDENQPDAAYSYMPRMSFEMNNLTYDSSRKRSSMSKVYQPNATGTAFSYTYAEVPYNLDFSVHILSRKMEDGLQIIEQILPFLHQSSTLHLILAILQRK